MAGFYERMRERLRGQRKEPALQVPEREDAELDSLANRSDELERMTRGQTAEQAEAYQLGQRMGAAHMVSLSGGTPFKGAGAQGAGRMNVQRLNKATETLLKYQEGKASVEARVISAQNWWKLKDWDEIRSKKGVKGLTAKPSNTGWLWNCIVGKHADHIDSFPEPVILPRMEDDKEEAERLSDIVPVVMEINDFEETYNDCGWQKLQEGTAVYGIFWNSSKLNGLGDIDIKKVNILNLYWEPGISDIQESRNVFFVSFEDKDDLISRYPELDGQLKTNKLSVKNYKTDDDVDMSNKIPVIDWYYKVWQDGRNVLHYCKYVGEKVLYCSEDDSDAPDGKEPPAVAGFYDHGLYPFVFDPLYPVEGSPAGYGMIDIAKDVQSDIDTLNQAMVRNAVLRAIPRYFSRKDGGVNETEFGDFTKPLVHVNGSLSEELLRAVEVPQMGSEAQQMLMNKIDEIKFVTGNTDVNNGGVPTGVTAASAIAALKEDSGRSSKDSNKAAYRSYKKIVNMVIELIRQMYDIPRQFRILGQQDGQERFVRYSNEGLQVQQIKNLEGQEPGLRLPVFDIEVRAQRETAYTKLSNNELALQLYQMGLMSPQMTDQALMVLDMMDFRGKDELRRRVQAQGTMQDTLVQVAQIAMALAQQYQPEVAEQLAGVINGVAQDAGAHPAGGGTRKGIAGELAPGDASEAPINANENALVRRARERTANASRVD